MRESELGRARRAKRAASRSMWRDAVLNRDSFHCRMYDVIGECAGALRAHHVLPISHGGKEDLGNGLTLCDWHHTYVHAHPTWSYQEGYLLRTPPQQLHKPVLCSCGHPSADHRSWGQWDAVKCFLGCDASACISDAGVSV